MIVDQPPFVISAVPLRYGGGLDVGPWIDPSFVLVSTFKVIVLEKGIIIYCKYGGPSIAIMVLLRED